MEYRNLGRSGLKVSRLCLGCMSYGVPQRGAHPWTIDEAAEPPVHRPALELGINFFDTANIYSDGTSEEILGRALKDLARRDEVVIATKVYHEHAQRPQRPRPVAQGDSDRDRSQPPPLGHRLHRPVPNPPLGLPHADRGNARRPGRRGQAGQSPLSRRLVDARLAILPSRCTWPTRHGWTRFVSMQNHYNLSIARKSGRCSRCARAKGSA